MDQTASLYRPRGLTRYSSRPQNFPSVNSMHPPAYRPKLSMTHSRRFLEKFHHLACMRQQPLFAAISSRAHHAPSIRHLCRVTLHVCLPSSFSVISHSRASESSALLMEISITSAHPES